MSQGGKDGARGDFGVEVEGVEGCGGLGVEAVDQETFCCCSAEGAGVGGEGERGGADCGSCCAEGGIETAGCAWEGAGVSSVFVRGGCVVDELGW